MSRNLFRNHRLWISVLCFLIVFSVHMPVLASAQAENPAAGKTPLYSTDREDVRFFAEKSKSDNIQPQSEMGFAAEGKSGPVAKAESEAEPVRLLHGKKFSPRLTSDENVKSFVAENSEKLLGVGISENKLKMDRKLPGENGKTHYRYQQVYHGIPVYGNYLQVHLDEDRQVYAVQNDLDNAEWNVNPNPSLAEEEAVDILRRKRGAGDGAGD